MSHHAEKWLQRFYFVIKSRSFSLQLLTYVRNFSSVAFLSVMFNSKHRCLGFLFSLWRIILLLAVQCKSSKVAVVWVKNCLAYLPLHFCRWVLRRKHIRLKTVATTVVSKVKQIIAVLYMKITLVYDWVIIADFSLVVPVQKIRIVKYPLMPWFVNKCDATYAIFKFWNLLCIFKANLQAFCNSNMVREAKRVFCSFLVKSVFITAYHVDHLLNFKWRLAFTFLLILRSPLILNMRFRSFTTI